jgi:hypothetical protein
VKDILYLHGTPRFPEFGSKKNHGFSELFMDASIMDRRGNVK